MQKDTLDKEALQQAIQSLKSKRQAIIMAHLYQPAEVQEIADFIGDSLELSKKAAETEAQTIVFCGVKFMAETAKILSPEKTVLLPALDAGCPLADMIEKDDVLRLKAEHPKAAVVCYVNSTAEVKAVSDYCCTSSNAVSLVKGIPEQEIIFIPDMNLGHFVANLVPEKKIILWEGFCVTHYRLTAQDVETCKKLYPKAPILVHPECRPEVVEKADFVGSTGHILKFVQESRAETFIIGTEMGILHKLEQENPGKKFYLLASGLLCPNMKKTRLQDIYHVLRDMNNTINVPENVSHQASAALDRMLCYS